MREGWLRDEDWRIACAVATPLEMKKVDGSVLEEGEADDAVAEFAGELEEHDVRCC